MTARIVLVDDHPLFRKGISALIEMSSGLTVVGEASSRTQALDVVAAVRPHLVLLDLTLGEDNGLELLKDLRSLHPDLKILVLSMHDESLYAQRALAAGAGGYVEKNEASELVLEAIRTVMSGGRWLSPSMQDRLSDRARPMTIGTDSDGIEALSDREFEVFSWLGRGLGVSRIAAQLHLSVKTIETYQEHLKQKLGFRDNQELKISAIEWNSQKKQG